MKILFACLLFSVNLSCFAQEHELYEWEELSQLVHNPDTIYRLSLRKMKLDSLLVEIYRYKNLKELDLSKNHLTKLPLEIVSFNQLEKLNLERNRFEIFPIVFCRMSGLKVLNLGLNQIEVIPICIEGLSQIEKLYLYDNPISTLPEEITLLKSLRYLDLGGIRFSPQFQESWIEKLPETKVDFDAPCDCMK